MSWAVLSFWLFAFVGCGFVEFHHVGHVVPLLAQFADGGDKIGDLLGRSMVENVLGRDGWFLVLVLALVGGNDACQCQLDVVVERSGWRFCLGDFAVLVALQDGGQEYL